MRIRTGLILALAGATLTAACSGASGSATTSTPAARAASTSTPASTGATGTTSTPRPAGSATTGTTTSAATAAATAKAAVARVNANTATRDEIQRALEAAGVPAAANWSREVVEYRPYSKDDTNWTKLRGELAKYNPSPGVVDQIVAVLDR
ncbi:MAG: hypothetical protein U0360_01335 [Dehalococcoidia bacterium]